MDKRARIKGNQINWNQVFYFCQIALHGSIKGAASALGLTSPTLSEHLNQLEKDLEVVLFHRQHRKLVLSSEGARLFQHAKQMFEAGQRLIDVVSPIPLGCYPLSISIVPGPSMWLAYRLVADYAKAYGPVNMRVVQSHQEELEKALVEARTDFGFSDRGAERKNVVAHLVAASVIRFYVSSQWEEKRLEELLETLPLLLFSPESTTRSYTDHLLTELDLTPKAVITSEYPALLQQLCESGQGIGVFNEASVMATKAKLRAIKLPKGALEIQDRLYALWTHDAEKSEAVRRLKDTLETPQFTKYRGSDTRPR